MYGCMCTVCVVCGTCSMGCVHMVGGCTVYRILYLGDARLFLYATSTDMAGSVL